MLKSVLIFLCLGIFSLSYAQKIEIRGKISDRNGQAIENATVYLVKKKDSIIVNYISSSKEGNFSLKSDVLNEQSVLTIDAERFARFSKNFEELKQSEELGTIILEKDSVVNIEEVTINASPVRIKKDTIEFSASAVKLRPDSKVEELLKQIPGIEISNDGKVTANGKEVDQIMINGKPFFDKDGRIAMQNLPADMIKKIQITTTKTKEEEAQGKSGKSENATINLTIDEKKNKGLLTRLTAGYGTDKRDEASGILSYFNKDKRVSLLASSNNINSQGFSNDEIFDSMGQGRNSWLLQSGGSVVRRGRNTFYMSGAGSKGIMRNTIVGLNFTDKLSKEVEINEGSLLLIDSDMETRSKVARTTLLPDYTLGTVSENSGNNLSTQLNAAAGFRIKPDSLTTILIYPNFSSTSSLAVNKNASSTMRDGVLLNQNDAYNRADVDTHNFGIYINFSRKSKKKEKRQIYGNLANNINASRDRTIKRSSTLFFQSGQPNDVRDQKLFTNNDFNSIDYALGYTEPISDSATLSFHMRLSRERELHQRSVRDFDPSKQQYSVLNNPFSYDLSKNVNSIVPEISIEWDKKKFTFWSGIMLNFANLDVNSFYNGQRFHLRRSYTLPEYNLNFQYKFSQSKTLSLYNHSDFNFPTALQFTPYDDISNPLITYRGNPDLKPSWTSNTYLFFNNHILEKNLNIFANIGLNYYDNNISNYSFYDASGKQFVTYVNISGTKYFWMGAGVTKTYKWKENKFTVNPRVNASYNYNRGFIEGQMFTSDNYTITPTLNLTYEMKDRLTVKPSYMITYRESNYKNYVIDRIDNSAQTLKLELTNYLLNGNLIFGNDFQYTTNSNITPGFKRDFYLWNTSLGYSFLKKQLTAKVKVYDVLNQNQAVTRSITSTYIEDREDLILRRYLMFSLSMKLNKFGGKKAD